MRLRLGKLKRSLDAILPQLRAIDSRVQLRSTRITHDAVREALQSLRELLRQDISVAALAIREMTGLIRIRQEPIPGSVRNSRWIAEFTPQYGGLLRRALDTDDETSRMISAALPPAAKVTIVIQPNFSKPRPQKPGRAPNNRLTPEARVGIEAMLQAGRSTVEIVEATGCCRTTIYMIRRAMEKRLQEQSGAQDAA